MFSAHSLRMAGRRIADRLPLLKKDRKPRLINVLIPVSDLPKSSTLPSPSEMFTAIANGIAKLDTRYQSWMQRHIDPLLGKQRYAHLQALSNEDELQITPDERSANHFLAINGAALIIALVGGYFLPVFLPIAGIIALLSLSPLYVIAYHEWQKKRRVGAIHLLIIFLIFIFLGGYALIGALTCAISGIGHKIRAIGEKENRSNLINIFKLKPQVVWVRKDDLEIEIPFAQIAVGDTLVLHAGQVVPVDGTVLAGIALVDQQMLTGEAQPVEKISGDPVLAATLVISGKIDVQVEKTGKDTTTGQIGEVLNRSTQSQLALSAKIHDRMDQLALPTLLISGASLPLVGVVGAVTLLGANYTTTTMITAPLSILHYLNKAARRGILIKGVVGLERLSQIDTVVFDKTGTLTLEQPQVAQVYRLQALTEVEILTLAAAAEARQTHPIAHAIRAAAEAQHLSLPAIDQAHYEVGYGLKVWLRFADHAAAALSSTVPTLVRVGSARFMTMEGLTMPSRVDDLLTVGQAQGHSLVLVAMAEQVVGAIELQPMVRPEAIHVVEELRSRGLAIYIISGDHETPTRTLAQNLGMTGYFANALPGEKAELVKRLQATGRQVCFIGDGINDALAMRQAQVSISLRGATTVATDTAQIVLMEGNLNQLVPLFALAKQFTSNLELNFRVTATASAVGVAGILFAHFSVVAIELLYMLSFFTSLGIALRPMLDRQPSSAAEHEPLVASLSTADG